MKKAITPDKRQLARDRILNRRDVRAGVAAAEFALCIPLLLLVAFAATDFGRIAYFHQAVCNAARTGAETGATHRFTAFTQTAWENEVRQAVLAEMQNLPDFNPSELTFDLEPTIDGDDLARVHVSVSYPFRPVIAWPGLPGEIMLHKRVEFRQFR